MHLIKLKSKLLLTGGQASYLIIGHTIAYLLLMHAPYFPFWPLHCLKYLALQATCGTVHCLQDSGQRSVLVRWTSGSADLGLLTLAATGN